MHISFVELSGDPVAFEADSIVACWHDTCWGQYWSFEISGHVSLDNTSSQETASPPT